MVMILCVAMLYTAQGKPGKKPKGPKVIAPEDTVLAIYSVEGKGVDASLAEALSPHLVMVINKYRGKVQVVQTEAVQKALDQVGLAASGACTDTECLPGLGEILGANRFLVTNLSKLKTYTVYASVYDAESGALMFTEYEKGTASEDDLPDSVERLASRIMSRLNGKIVKKAELPEPPPPPPPGLQPEQPKIDEPPVGARHAVPKGVGSLYVTTTPKGADVYIDAELKGKTPIEVKNLSAGDHDLMVTMKGHAPLTKTVTVTANKRTDVVERLSQQKGRLTIKSNPPGAAAYLDGKYIGKTPVELPGILIGDHSVKFEMKDYNAEERSIKVEVGGDAEVAVNLQGMPGKVLIATVPEGAQVFIDGKEVGATTYSGEIPAGKHRIKVSKSGYKSKEEDVEIAPNRAKQLSWTLEKGPDIQGDMVYVPAGDFMMGCNSAVDKECQDDENPYHKVYLDAFYIDKYEVTVDNYKACVDAGRCKEASKGSGKFVEHYNWGKAGRGNHPINGVDWNQAKTYCEYSGGRLPTEAEWEKAARGTDGRKYPWGNNWSERLSNFGDSGKKDGYDGTSPVGSFSGGASPYGALDMAGNVWEWTSDWYDEKYYIKSPGRNPEGLSSGTYRVLRGGSWRLYPSGLRTSNHGRNDPGSRNDDDGFRCARTF